MTDLAKQRQMAVLLSLADIDTVRRILQTLGNQAALHELRIAEQERYAQHLQQIGTDRKTIAIRMTQRFGVSLSTAYLRLKKISPVLKTPDFSENRRANFN